MKKSTEVNSPNEQCLFITGIWAEEGGVNFVDLIDAAEQESLNHAQGENITSLLSCIESIIDTQ